MADFKNKTKAEPVDYHMIFSGAAQKVLLGGLLINKVAFPQVRPMLQKRYFEAPLGRAIEYTLEYWDKYGTVPPLKEVEQNGFVRFENDPDAEQPTTQYFLNTAESFCRYKAYESAIVTSVEYVSAGQLNEVGDLIDAARKVGLNQEDPYGAMWGDDTSKIAPPTYLIKPWLIRDTVSAVYGAPGSFKSFFVLDAALALATGKPYAGLTAVRKTSVAYIAAEGESGIAMRKEAWEEANDRKLGPNEIVFLTRPVNLMDGMAVANLIQYLKRQEDQRGIKFGLIVFDTLSQCMSGANENASEAVTVATSNMIRIRREMATTVIFVHHSGKDASREMRGSNAIKGNTDAMIEVDRNDESMQTSAIVKRQKEGPTGHVISIDMLVQEIPRFAGNDLSNSLVCDYGRYTAESSNRSNLSAGEEKAKQMTLLRQITSNLEIGESKSVAAILKLMGKSDSTKSKVAVSDALPLDMGVEVMKTSGEVIGILTRSVGGKSQYGDISRIK